MSSGDTDGDAGCDGSIHARKDTGAHQRLVEQSSTAKCDSPSTEQPADRICLQIDFNDLLVWCEDCKKSVKDPCQSHGPLTIVKDRKIPSRAKLTAPHHVGVKMLELRAGTDHVYGIFAHKIIQKRTRFGPYEGHLSETCKYKGDDRMKLKLFLPGGDAQWFDCSDQAICNWLMFIRPAKALEEQNLVIHQHKASIYFTTTRAIAQNEELRAWYSPDYAAMMGADVLPPTLDAARKTTEDMDNGYRNDDDADDGGDNNIENSCITEQEDSHNREISDSNRTNGSTESQPPLGISQAAIPPASKSKRRQSALRTRSTLPRRASSILRTHQDHHAAKVVTLNSKLDTLERDPAGDDDVTDENCVLQSNISDKCVDSLGDRRYQADPSDEKEAKETVQEKKFGVGRRTKNKHKGRPVKCLKLAKKPGKRGRPRLGKCREMHTCEDCGKAFATATKLKIHSYSHSGERPHKCTYEGCDKGFTTRFKMLRHHLIHEDSQQFQCSYCEKSFSRKDHLKNHIKVHDPNKELLQCDKCGKQYCSPLAYKTHLAFHAMDQGETTCGVCSQPFDDKESLSRHLKAHAGARSVKDGLEKTKKCPSCDRMFFTNKDVQRHMVVHTKERDFMCHLCPQRFGRRDHLVRHMKKSHAEASMESLSTKSASFDVQQAELTVNLESPGSYAKSDLVMPDPEKLPSPSQGQAYRKHGVTPSQVATETTPKQPKARRRSKSVKIESFELQEKKAAQRPTAQPTFSVAGSLPLPQIQIPGQASIIQSTEIQVPPQQMQVLPSAMEPVSNQQPVSQLPMQMLPQILCASDGGLHIPLNVQIQQPALLQNMASSVQLSQPTMPQPAQQQALTHSVSGQTLSDSAIVLGNVNISNLEGKSNDLVLHSVNKYMSGGSVHVSQAVPVPAAPVAQLTQMESGASQLVELQNVASGSLQPGTAVEAQTMSAMTQGATFLPSIIRRSQSMQQGPGDLVRPTPGPLQPAAGVSNSSNVGSAAVIVTYSDTMRLLTSNDDQPQS